MFVATETPGRSPSSVWSGMFGGQGAANAIVPVFQAMRLLTELMPVQDGFNYRPGAPDGAFACFIRPRTARFGLPAFELLLGCWHIWVRETPRWACHHCQWAVILDYEVARKHRL